MNEIVAVLEAHGATVPFGYGWRRMRCPYHDDSVPSAAINVDSGRFHCFVCDINEDAVGLLMVQDRVSYDEARRLLETLAGCSGTQVRAVAGGCPALFGGQGDRRRRRTRVPAWKRVGT